MTDHTEAITTARDEAREASFDRGAFLIMMAILVLAPAVVYPVFVMKGLCFALFACAFNLLIGFGGLLSFGHAMFLGTAGYICAHLAKVGLDLDHVTLFKHTLELGLRIPPLSPELAIIVAVIATALLGLVTGLLAIKRQGIYFAMITLALAQMVYFFYLQAPFT